VKIKTRKKAKKEDTFFDETEWWEEHWQGMPDYTSESQMPQTTLYIHFKNKEDRERFAELVGQKIGPRTKSIWYPEKEIIGFKDHAWVDGDRKIKRRRRRDK